MTSVADVWQIEIDDGLHPVDIDAAGRQCRWRVAALSPVEASVAYSSIILTRRAAFLPL